MTSQKQPAYMTSRELGERWRTKPQRALRIIRAARPTALFRPRGCKQYLVAVSVVLDFEREVRGCGWIELPSLEGKL